MGIELLDCTLRDGSYQVDYSFSRETTSQTIEALMNGGIGRVEIGHGLGIGASEKIRQAGETDIDYAKAAAELGARWGMFALPSVASRHEIQALADEGMKFIRVGIDAEEVEAGQALVDFITNELSDLEVFVNFMKSHRLNPLGIARLAKRFEGSGICGVYLVDSSGGMTPDQVEDYGKQLLDSCSFEYFGFHGHNNLGLAVANSLRLAQLGFNLIDATLQGIGRSAGNTPVEQLLATLIKSGLQLRENIDLLSVVRAGESLIRPLLTVGGTGALDTMAGFYNFHSSGIADLLEVCSEEGVDELDAMRLANELGHESLSYSVLKDSIRELGGTRSPIDGGRSGHYSRDDRDFSQ